MKKLWLYINNPKYNVVFFRFFALILVISILYLLITNWEKNISLLAALGILISALLASFSVMLGIDTTIQIKNREIQDQVRETFFDLCQIKMFLFVLKEEQKHEKISYLDFDRIVNITKSMRNISLNTKERKATTIMHTTVLTDLYFLFFNIDIENIFLENGYHNIVEPPAHEKRGIRFIKNPLNFEHIHIDKSINQVTNVLTYLKEGYPKFLPDSNGIEQCAGFQGIQNDTTS